MSGARLRGLLVSMTALLFGGCGGALPHPSASHDLAANESGPCGTACAGACRAGRCLVTLASGQASPFGIVVDATGVYWMSHVTPYTDDRVSSVPLTGGDVTVLASGQHNPWGMAVDATSVYWTNVYGDGTVMKVPKGVHTAPMALAIGQNLPKAVAVNATGVYWTNWGTPGGDNGRLMSVPLDGGTATTLASGLSLPCGIAVDSTTVYWVNEGVGGESVMSVPLAGGAPTVLASGQQNPDLIAVDATTIYWANHGTSSARFTDGSIMKMPRGGGPATTLAYGQNNTSGLVVDGVSVYWVAHAPDGEGRVMRVSSEGGPSATLFAGAGISSIAVDATSVYFTDEHDGTVMKLTPK